MFGFSDANYSLYLFDDYLIHTVFAWFCVASCYFEVNASEFRLWLLILDLDANHSIDCFDHWLIDTVLA